MSDILENPKLQNLAVYILGVYLITITVTCGGLVNLLDDYIEDITELKHGAIVRGAAKFDSRANFVWLTEDPTVEVTDGQ